MLAFGRDWPGDRGTELAEATAPGAFQRRLALESPTETVLVAGAWAQRLELLSQYCSSAGQGEGDGGRCPCVSSPLEALQLMVATGGGRVGYVQLANVRAGAGAGVVTWPSVPCRPRSGGRRFRSEQKVVYDSPDPKREQWRPGPCCHTKRYRLRSLE